MVRHRKPEGAGSVARHRDLEAGGPMTRRLRNGPDWGGQPQPPKTPPYPADRAALGLEGRAPPRGVAGFSNAALPSR